jgi:hypothetical protein
MTRPGPALMLGIALAIGVPLAGCGHQYVRRYQDLVDLNRRNVDRLQLGMSRVEVERVMGSGELMRYKRMRLSNPWHTEAFRLQGPGKVEILYYVTKGYAWQTYFDNADLTPVVLENDKVVGWGREFLMRNQRRYTLESEDD